MANRRAHTVGARIAAADDDASAVMHRVVVVIDEDPERLPACCYENVAGVLYRVTAAVDIKAPGVIADLLEGRQPELCVAGIQSVCSHFLPPIITQFCQRYPNVQLRVTALGSDRSLKVLRDGLVDIAIVMHNPMLTSSQEMAVTPLYDEQVEVLMAIDHPLASYSPAPWAEIARYPHVVFKDGYGMQRLVQSQVPETELKMALELNTLDAFRGVVRQGKMIALLPQSALAESRRDPGLAVRSTAAPILTRQAVLVTTDRKSVA